MLVEAGLATKLYSYPLIVEKTLGQRSRLMLEVTIALTQYAFAVSHIVFLISSWKTSVTSLFGIETEIFPYAITILIIYTSISWVRDLAKFSFAFILGVVLIIITTVYVIAYSGWMIAEQGGAGEGVVFLNEAGYLSTLGFTIYSYEGIGVVMPIMATCDNPQGFKSILSYAFICLVACYVIFPELVYYAYGSSIDQSIITEMLPSDSIVVALMKFGYSLNLVASFPIIINPTNAAVERWFCSCLKQKAGTYYWMQNFSRFLVTLSAIVFAVVLADKLDKFLGLLGSLLCAPLALTFPALVHLKHLAVTRSQKAVDIGVIFISTCIFFFCTS